MRTLRSILFATALAVPACAAHAQVGVYIGAGQPAYREYVPAGPGPGYEGSAGYNSYGSWMPGRWSGGEQWRRHEFREHEAWEHRDRDGWRDREYGEHHGPREGYGYGDHAAYRDGGRR